MNRDILSLIVSYGIPDVDIDDRIAIRGAKYLTGKVLSPKIAKDILKLAPDFDILYPNTGELVNSPVTLSLFLYAETKFDLSKDNKFKIYKSSFGTNQRDLIEYLTPWFYSVSYDYAYILSHFSYNINVDILVKGAPKSLNLCEKYLQWTNSGENRDDYRLLQIFAECGYTDERLIYWLGYAGHVNHVRMCLEKLGVKEYKFTLHAASLEMYQLCYDYGSTSTLHQHNLRLTIRRRNLPLVKFFVSKGVTLDPNWLIRENLEWIKELISLGCEVNKKVLEYYRLKGTEHPATKYLSSFGYFSKDES